MGTDIPGGGGGNRVAVVGKTVDATNSNDAYPRAQIITTSVKYFDVLRVMPLMGRAFTEGDLNGGRAR